MSKKQHARYSPSALDRLSRCIRFKFVESDDMQDAADEGTMLHAAVESGNMTGLDEMQKKDVQHCLDYLMLLKSGKGVPELKEAKLVLADRTFGHADHVIIDLDNSTVHVLDWKFTRVEGEHDFQLTCYGAAVFEHLYNGDLKLADGTMLLCTTLHKIVTHVVAPRLHAPEVNEYQAQELYDSVVKRIDELYERIDNPFNPPTPEADLCSRCARASICPAISQSVVAAAPRISTLPMPEAFAPDALVNPQDRAFAHQLAQVFENWAEAVKKANTEYVKNGGEIPGFKLQTRSTGYVVPRESTLSALDKLATAFQWGIDQVGGALKLSVTELAKQMAPLSGKKESELKAEIVGALEGVGVNGSATFLAKMSKADKARKVIAE